MEDASANLFTAGSMSPMDPIANSTVDELNTAPTTSADANTSTTTNDEDVGDVTSPSASSDQPTPSSDSIITSPDASPMMMMEHYRGDGTDAFVQELFGTPPVVFSSCPLLDADMFRAYVNYLYHDSTYMRRPPLRLKSAIRSLEQQHRDALKQLRGRVKAFEALDAIIHIRRREQVALQWGDKLSRLEASLVKSAGNDKSIAAISEVRVTTTSLIYIFAGVTIISQYKLTNYHYVCLLYNFLENSGSQGGVRRHRGRGRCHSK